MTGKHLFLSYRRSATGTPAVERLSKRARVQLASTGVQVFFDKQSIDAGDAWSPAIDEALARVTHFLAFVSIDYWLSEQCMRELETAVARYERTGVPRLLFVLADQLDPNDLALDPEAATRRLTQDEASAAPLRRVASAGQINFLGPYDAAGRLVRLDLESPARLDDQLAALIETLKPLLRD